MKLDQSILRNFLKDCLFVLPVFFAATLVGTLIQTSVPAEWISQLTSGYLIAIPLAALAGILFPIPRYATYPIAFAVFTQGAGYGVVFALIAGEVISESIIGDLAEIRMLGWRFYLARTILSLIFITLGGYMFEVVL